MRERDFLRSILIRWRRVSIAGKFCQFGDRVYIFERVMFGGSKFIEIGDDVVIQRDNYLAADDTTLECFAPRLVIGSGSNIGPRNHIYAQKLIEIGEKVLTGPNVFISDCSHGFMDLAVPIIDQPVKSLGLTSIGSHSWIGHGSAIIGCRVGKHSVVGANSVVLSDVPDFSVAVGAPAKVVRQFDHELGVWACKN